MTPSPIDSYLERLRRELQRHFIVDSRIIQEVRDHFADALDGGHHQDRSLAAEARAIERFGSPELVAAAFVADRTRNLHRSLLVAATVAGIAIAFVDARATWDDAGITAVLARLARAWTREGISVQAPVVLGSVTSEALPYARSVDADLVACGSHGCSAVERVLLGSMSTKILREAQCAVLVAPPEDSGEVSV